MAVIGSQRVLNCSIDVTILAQPLCGAAVKHRHPIRPLRFECATSDCTKKMVETKPLLLSVKWDEKKVRMLQVAENSSGLPLAGHISTQRRCESLNDRHIKAEVAYLLT